MNVLRGQDEMLQAGHVLISASGALISADRGFGAIMRADPCSLLGREVLAITAPADRAECGAAIAGLIATRTPFRIAKRLLRDDGTLVWVVNSVSIVESQGDADMIVATIDPVRDAEGDRAPARLLDCARFLVSCKQDRASVCDPGLFPDTGWDAILAAYIAEAEGQAIDGPALATKLGMPAARALRWIDVLLGQGVLEVETREADPFAAKSFRLTTDAHRRLEAHLSKVSHARERSAA